MGFSCQCHTPAALPLGIIQDPLYRMLGGHPGKYGHVQKISPLEGFHPWTIQPVASHYTDYAIPVLNTSTY